ncbi:CopY/TcrY family copper transport repressor [Bombilactobacillus bombi]|uniref:CopY/TcrY family copper transport repressor n=1 Tax=Bombilactobacillus bombi TaxID=1303590 RepID=UPI0015E5CB47|nr:CopY/TcrY family copper transport repressor [Bombilactobacillus bombi]MBA1434834.1 CopY/TcrY family copper transport repressor [Bombilactobacillus bombi]
MEEISNAEWEVMRVVWTLKQATAQEIIANLQQYHWRPATIKTLIGRLIKKNCLAAHRQQRPFVYYPLVKEEATMNHAADALFSHLCAMKRGQTLFNLLEQTPLTQSDIQKIQTLLEYKAQHAPTQIACNCLLGGEQC